MARKENKGGILSNEEVEQDLKAKGRDQQQPGYSGVQDTGDKTIRSLGSEVQKRDGLPEEEEQNRE